MPIPDSLAGERLDKALEALCPGTSLRHRRRLVESGAVLLNGRPARPGVRVRPGQVLELGEEDRSMVPEGVTVLHRQGAYGAVTKPCGLHSASMAGSTEPSVEAALPLLFSGEEVMLLNRLDRETSGFVLVAFSHDAVARFRELEGAGRVRKEYLALVEGELDAPSVIRNRLDMADRKRVRVLEEHDPDPARHTHAEPLGRAEGRLLQGFMVRAVIGRGARHQIRAHLAHAGVPILGDTLYGHATASEPGRMYLHHRAITFEGFSAVLEPHWK